MTSARNLATKAVLPAIALALGTCAAGAFAQEDPPRPVELDGRGDPGREPSVVRLPDVDPDALLIVERQLAVRGFYRAPVDGQTRPELEAALVAFAGWRGTGVPGDPGDVLATTIDELGCGREVALRWGSSAPRAPELTEAERYRVNFALVARGYRRDGTATATIDSQTVDALRRFQKDTGHPVQLGSFIARRWLFILGVATPESCPAEGTLPAGLPR